MTVMLIYLHLIQHLFVAFTVRFSPCKVSCTKVNNCDGVMEFFQKFDSQKSSICLCDGVQKL